MSRPARKPTLWILRKVSNPDQPKHAAQAYPDRHLSPPVDFLFQEALLFTSIPLIRNVSSRIRLRGLRRLIRVDTLRRGHNVGFSRRTAHIKRSKQSLRGRYKGEVNWSFIYNNISYYSTQPHVVGTQKDRLTT